MPLLIRVRTVVLGAGTVVTISAGVTSFIITAGSVSRADAGVAVSVAKADRTTSAARVTAVLDLPVRVAVRSFPGLVSIPLSIRNSRPIRAFLWHLNGPQFITQRPYCQSFLGCLRDPKKTLKKPLPAKSS